MSDGDDPITLHDSITPAALAHRGAAKFAKRNQRLNASEAGDGSPPIQTGLQTNLATKKEIKPVS